MAKWWVVVADSAQARLFSVTGPMGPLEELETLAHPEGRMREQDLVSDLPGRTFDSAGEGRHGKEVPVRPKQQEAIRFAEKVAERLETGRKNLEFGSLIIVAAPAFLGLLRDKLTPQLRALVTLEMNKNLVRQDAREIRALLPERLPLF
jgi:protein required for attachment to host cells